VARIAIAGHPRSGKSTLADQLPGPHRTTDSLLETFQDWDAIVATTSKWLDAPGPWTISGVVVPHALSLWHNAHPRMPPPLEYFVFVRRPTFDGLTKGQTIMAKGIDTVMGDIRRWLTPVTTDTVGILSHVYVSTTEKRS